MFQEILVLSINALLYSVLAFFYLCRYGFCFKTMPLIIWSLSAVCSIAYFLSPYRFLLHSYTEEVTLLPLLYLFTLVWISFLPLLKFDQNKMLVVEINQNLFTFLCIFLIVISLFTFYQNISYFRSNVTSLEFFVEQKEEIASGGKVEIFHGITAKVMILINYFHGIIPLFLVLSFTNLVRRNILIRSGMIFVCLNLMLFYLNNAARFSFMTDFLYLFFCFLLLHKFFSRNMQKWVKLIGAFVGVFFFAVISLITVARFGEDSGYTATIDFTLTRYAGESFPNFSADLWDVQELANGDNSFWFFKQKVQGKSKMGRDPDVLARKVHRRMHVFYTFIGDFYADFGRYNTVLFVTFLSFIIIVLTRFSFVCSISKIIVISIYSKILLLGITYMTYLNYSYEILGSLFVAFLFYIANKFSSNMQNFSKVVR